MSNTDVRPSTIDGIKRLAKTIKKMNGSAHTVSLDAAAVAAGFENYAHARRRLQKNGIVNPEHLAWISVPWRDPNTSDSGQEILEVRLGTSITELVSSRDLRRAVHFMQFRFAATDHLRRVVIELPQSYARQMACAAARTLDFMDATKLRPTHFDARNLPDDILPDRDHSTMWHDPSTATYVLVDEPYWLSYDGMPDDRLAWADRNDFEIVRPTWRGMYNPFGGCEMYLATKKSSRFDLHAACATLNALPVRFDERKWVGRSEPFSPRFRSPVGQLAQKMQDLGGKHLTRTDDLVVAIDRMRD